MRKFSLMLLMSVAIALFSCKSSNTGTVTDPNINTDQGMRNDNIMQDQATMQDNTRRETGTGTMNTNRSGTGNINTGTIGTDDPSSSMDTNMNGSTGTIDTDTSNMGNGNDYGSLQDDILGKNMDDMYGQLNMTEDQINRYKTVANKRMDAINNNRIDRSSLNRDMLMKNQDADMEQVLSTEQYTKYQSFVKDYYPTVGGKGPGGTINNNR